ncbi:hypothetical protein BDR07DRAFT_1482240 [Suillus spraguei]|nr:hypothetical protein BDR07DRAFT_1482240 [Suillus spraguei]
MADQQPRRELPEPPQANILAKPSAAFKPKSYNFMGMVNGRFDNLGNTISECNDTIPGSSAMKLTIPMTHIIPPTPTGLGDWYMPAGPGDWDMFVLAPFAPFAEDAVMDAAMDEGDVGPSFVRGQRNDETNAALQEGFVRLESIINELSHQTSIPSSQIISLWNKSHARTVNNMNHWNAYAHYFKNNIKQELSRLGEETPEAPGMPSTNVHSKCYDAFKKSFPNDWQDILEIYGESSLFLGGPQTVSAQGQEFQKFTKKLSGLMDIGSAHFGFEAALVACGKVVNQDRSLGMAHTTSGANGFWLSCCKADKDTIISHLKAQVYNIASLTVFDEAFQDEVMIVQGNTHVDPPAELVDIPKNGSKWIKDEICHQIKQHNCKLSSLKIFPWKTLPSALTHMSLVIKGYPEDVLLPSEIHSNANKGIANLTLKEISIIVAALQAGSMSIKKVSEANKSKLVTSEVPILVGAPPAVDSMHLAGCCLFTNGQSDCKGPSRLKQSLATSKSYKGKSSQKAPTLPPSMLSLSEDEAANVTIGSEGPELGGAEERMIGGAEEGRADERTSGRAEGADERTSGGADERTSGTSGRADERTSGRADERDERTSGRADERTSGRADERTSGRADEWTSGRAESG